MLALMSEPNRGTIRPYALLVTVLLVGLAVLAGCGAEEEASSGNGSAEETTSATRDPTTPSEEGDYDATVTVTRVIDGDTVEISPAVDGIEELRFIGVDAPETKDPDCGRQPYGREAREFTASELRGREVGLEFDEEKTDRNGRLLAYVYEDGEMFNERLLREGYAQVASFLPNTRYVERLEEAQEEARAAGRGIWALPEDQLAQQADRGNGIGGGCAQKGKAAKQKGKAAKQKAAQQPPRAASPAQIPSPSVSSTPGPSPAPTPSPALSPSPAPSPSPTPAPSSTPSPTPAPSPTPSPTPGPAPPPSPDPGPSPEPGLLPPSPQPEQGPAPDDAYSD